ncbi:MAG: hypothetical protein KF846_13765 [Cyclobacteriaceae bacterium]|nr:hypothetical protein [Cyclobacteriaceae bacterium]
MISILYPEGDFTSADIAIKLQALAQAQSEQIFIVPKHFGRNDENVFKNLSASKTALLLLHDKVALDGATKKEVEFLINKGAVIYSIAPIEAKSSLILPQKVSSHYYDRHKSGDFLNTVQSIVTDLQRRKDTISLDNDFGGILLVMALIILVIAAFSNDKK